MFDRRPQTAKSRMRRAFRRLGLLLLAAAPAAAAAEATPLLYAGAAIGLSFASPVYGEESVDAYAGGELSIGRRGTFGADGYYAVSSRFQGAIHEDLSFSDEEYLDLQMDFGAVAVEAALLSALFDDGSGSTYLNPSWNLEADIAALSDAGALSLEYSGYLACLPEDPHEHKVGYALNVVSFEYRDRQLY